MATDDKVLAIHKCKDKKGQGATIRFTTRLRYPSDQDYHWYLGGYESDSEDLENTYHVNYFKIKCCPFCMAELPPVDVPVLDKGALLYQEPVRTNKNGNNTKIKVNVLPEEKMREIGFTDFAKDTWFFFKMVYPKYEISFSVSVKKDNADDWRIDVLDEDFCQPYDYQEILRDDPTFEIGLLVRDEVEKYMKILKDAGVISGHEYGEYI